MSTPAFTELDKGQIIGTRTVTFSRADLIRYAAASGDHNPIHWNERFAAEVENRRGDRPRNAHHGIRRRSGL